MSNEVINTLILSVFLAAAVGTGYYFTKKQQPIRLAEVESEIEAIESRAVELEGLLSQEALASESAAQTLKQWNTRYKVLPTELSSPDVVTKAMTTLKGKARVKKAMWSRRAQEYEQKINSGDLIAIAEVVRDLHRADD